MCFSTFFLLNPVCYFPDTWKTKTLFQDNPSAFEQCNTFNFVETLWEQKLLTLKASRVLLVTSTAKPTNNKAHKESSDATTWHKETGAVRLVSLLWLVHVVVHELCQQLSNKITALGVQRDNGSIFKSFFLP